MAMRRTSPGPSWAPFWTMLAAVWAVVLLGGAPAAPHDVPCGTAPHPAHHSDGMACCTCTLAAPVQAILADVPGVPVPRGSSLGIAASPAQPAGDVSATVSPRARGPPATA